MFPEPAPRARTGTRTSHGRRVPLGCVLKSSARHEVCRSRALDVRPARRADPALWLQPGAQIPCFGCQASQAQIPRFGCQAGQRGAQIPRFGCQAGQPGAQIPRFGSQASQVCLAGCLPGACWVLAGCLLGACWVLWLTGWPARCADPELWMSGQLGAQIPRFGCLEIRPAKCEESLETGGVEVVARKMSSRARRREKSS